MTKSNKTRGLAPTPIVRFNLNKPNKSNSCLILAVFRYHNGKPQRLVYSSQQAIKPNQWNKKTQLPRQSHPYYNEIKRDLDKVKEAIRDVYISSPKIQLPKFKEELDIRLKRVEKRNPLDLETLVGYLTSYIETREHLGDKSFRTIQKYKTLKDSLVQYQDLHEVVLKCTDINKSFFEKYKYFLVNEKEPKVNSPNTINKYVANLKFVLREAKDDGLIVNEFLHSRKFTVKRQKTDKLALTDKELSKLQKHKFKKSDNKELEIVRDWYLISALSALRISDFLNISPTNTESIEGDLFLRVNTEKSKKEVFIPIVPELLTLLEKYNYESPSISPQTFNDLIKVVAEKAGLTQSSEVIEYEKGKIIKSEKRICDRISAHSARRTWASINYEKGIPILLLMQVTGHSKESTFLTYINRSSKDLAAQLMNKYKALAEDAKRRKMKIA